MLFLVSWGGVKVDNPTDTLLYTHIQLRILNLQGVVGLVSEILIITTFYLLERSFDRLCGVMVGVSDCQA